MNQSLENEILQGNQKIDYTKQYSDEFYEEYILNFKKNSKKKYFYRFIKRLFDFFSSLIALLLISPVLIITAIAIKIDSKGPVIFKQKRMGKNNEVFNCYKFRSMRTDAPKNAATSTFTNPEDYITKVGRFIRKTSIDELPQLINVLFGQMSVIGPRPVILTEEKLINMRTRLGVYDAKPGISGYSQVHGRDDVYYKNKAIMDAEYVKNRSLWVDLKLIFQTVLVVLGRKGNGDDKKRK